MNLYPLKFEPILKERIWGGTRLATQLGKDFQGRKNIGESWELSAVEGDISLLSNGPLAGNSLQELLEIYMDELVGEKNYRKYGNEFPLLIKFIDANADLSIQVHPDDRKARERHHAFGKTEMWYALDAADDSQIITGFEHDTNRDEFIAKLEDGSLTELFHYEKVSKEAVYFVPARRVHAICSGNLVAEIQQTSDITYRIYDYDRKDENGKGRDLHLDMALDVMDYTKVKNPLVEYEAKQNEPVQLVSCEYFTTNRLELTRQAERDYYAIDSFVIVICTAGAMNLVSRDGEKTHVKAGETILLPASLGSIVYEPLNDKVVFLEVYTQ
jgi:mannose-6-phosphate isomerase